MEMPTFDLASYFSNREISWILFNRRVLEEAQDLTHPLLEQLKFLCISGSNLDEFFEIRLAGLKQQIESKTIAANGPDRLTPAQTFSAARQMILDLVTDQYETWNKGIQPALEKNGIRLFEIAQLPEQDRLWAENYAMHEIFPVLTPLAIDPSHPFPQILNKSLNLLIEIQKKDDIRYAFLQAPRALPALIKLPDRPEGKHEFIYLTSLLEWLVPSLFSGANILGVHPFRLTRNSDLYIDPEESNLLATIEEELQHRNKGNAVRLEMRPGTPQNVQNYLLEKHQLTEEDIYFLPGPLTFSILTPLLDLENVDNLKDTPFHPAVVPELQGDPDFFAILRHRNVLLHHPYESFSSVVDFVEKAAVDPHVLAIKMTLYRTGGDSPILKALIHAARNNKQVTVLVELKARFDEAHNIASARMMEEAGINVVYGLVDLKTHCKMLMVVRRDEDKIRYYVHLGTGNYHTKTSRIYTDLGLLTANPEIGDEVAHVFNTLTGMSEFQGSSHLLVAPFNLGSGLLALIEREVEHAREGKTARIILKLNALSDEKTIKKLYEASCVGVKIDLIVRGICCLRPGIPRISENIRVISIVDRFLEHARIFYFENGGVPKLYLGSADCMPRNLYRRVETLFLIEDKYLRHHIFNEILETQLHDNVKARELQSDGTYVRVKHGESDSPCRSQAIFLDAALKGSFACRWFSDPAC